MIFTLTHLELILKNPLFFSRVIISSPFVSSVTNNIFKYDAYKINIIKKGHANQYTNHNPKVLTSGSDAKFLK